MPAIAAVDHGQVRTLIGERFNLLKRLVQGVPVLWVARHCANANHEALSDGRRNADLCAEFVADPCLALGDTVHLRRVHSVDLALGFRRLVQQLRDQNQQIKDPLPSKRRAIVLVDVVFCFFEKEPSRYGGFLWMIRYKIT